MFPEEARVSRIFTDPGDSRHTTCGCTDLDQQAGRSGSARGSARLENPEQPPQIHDPAPSHVQVYSSYPYRPSFANQKFGGVVFCSRLARRLWHYTGFR